VILALLVFSLTFPGSLARDLKVLAH